MKQTLRIGLAILAALGMPLAALAQTNSGASTADGNAIGSYNHVAINRWTSNPNYGNEQDFYQTGEFAGPNSRLHTATRDNGLRVHDGEEVVMRVMIHNDANTATLHAAHKSATAKDVVARVTLPAGAATKWTSVATISSSNASPRVVRDSVTLTAEQPFTVTYSKANDGWALYRSYPSAQQEQKIDSSVVEGGYRIGDLPPGKREGYIFFRVTVHMQNQTGGTMAPNTDDISNSTNRVRTDRTTGGVEAPESTYTQNTGTGRGQAAALSTSNRGNAGSPTVHTQRTNVQPGSGGGVTVNVSQHQAQSQQQSTPANAATAMATPVATTQPQTSSIPSAAPQTQAELPQTGTNTSLAGAGGLVAIGYAVYAYRRSRQRLSNALHHIDI